MAKCKNCYHYEACLYFLAKENKILNNSEGFVCGYYKDKSLIVELPCRIGDTVFIISRGDIINLTVNNISYSSYRRFLICKNEEHFGYGTVTLDMDNEFGAKWYLNREEAEMSLELKEK